MDALAVVAFVAVVGNSRTADKQLAVVASVVGIEDPSKGFDTPERHHTAAFQGVASSLVADTLGVHSRRIVEEAHSILVEDPVLGCHRSKERNFLLGFQMHPWPETELCLQPGQPPT